MFPLISCFQYIRRRILRFSSIQCCLALKRRFRFPSVVPDLRHRISYGTLPWYKFKFTRLTLAKCFAASVKSNLSWANQFAPCCVNLFQNLILSSDLSNRCCLGFGVASCSLIVSVFIFASGRKFESLNSSVLPCRSLRLWN